MGLVTGLMTGLMTALMDRAPFSLVAHVIRQHYLCRIGRPVKGGERSGLQDQDARLALRDEFRRRRGV